MTLNTYGHVIDELAEVERVSTEDEIPGARVEIRTISGSRGESTASDAPPEPQKPSYAGPFQVGDGGLEPPTSSLSERRSNRLS